MARTLKFASAADHFPTAPGQTPDPEQVAAVDTGGRVLVVAGAGAGKTTSVVARVSMLVKERHVDPRRILAVTFSKDAANEMKERIEKRVGGQAAQAASTIHSFCLRQLKSWGVPVNLEYHDTLLSILHEAVLEELELSASDGFKLANTRKNINLWIANRASIEELFKNPASTSVRVDVMVWSLFSAMKVLPLSGDAQYSMDRWLLAAKAARPWAQIVPFSIRRPKAFTTIVKAAKYVRAPSMDFDDLQTCLLYYLDGDNQTARNRVKSLRASYDHVIVDEGQDLNRVQYDIVQHLIGDVQTDDPDRSAWIVGDDWQSIYSFRGSDPKLFIDLANDPSWKVRRIQSNYRSTATVIAVSNNIAGNNKTKIDKNPVPGTKRQMQTGLMEIHTPDADNVGGVTCDVIARLVRDNGESLSGVAVLARTNNDLNEFEREMLERGVPYYRKGGSFFRRAEMASVLAWLRLSLSDRVKTGVGQALVDACKLPYRGQLTSGGSDRAALDLLASAPDPISMLRSGSDPIRDSTYQTLAREIELAHDAVTRAATPVKAIHAMLDTVQGSFAPRSQYDSAKRTGRSLRKEIIKKLAQKADDDSVADADAESTSADVHESYEEASRTDSTKLGTAGVLLRLAERYTDPAKTTVENSIKLLNIIDKMSKAAESNAKRTEEHVDVIGEDGKTRRVVRKAEKSEAVTLATCHAAKGREWNTVFAYLPSTFPRKDLSEDEMESERRLAYVQVSRAKSNLIAICPQSKDPRGPSGVSQFLLESKMDRHATFISDASIVAAPIVFGAWPDSAEIAKRIPTAQQRFDIPKPAPFVGRVFRGVRIKPIVHDGKEYVPFSQVASVAKHGDHVFYAKGGFDDYSSVGGIFQSMSNEPNTALVNLPDYDAVRWSCAFDLLYLELNRHSNEVTMITATIEPVLPSGKLPTLEMQALPPWARTAWAKAGIKRDDVAVIESPRHDKAINGSVYVSRSKEALSGYVSGATPTYDKPLGVWFVSDVVRMDYLAALGTTAAAVANHIQRAAQEFAIVPGVGADVQVQTSVITLDQEPDAKTRAKLVSKARKVLGAEAPEHADVLQVVVSGDDVIGASAVRSLSDETRFWVRGEAAAESRIAELLSAVLTTHSGANLTGQVRPVSTEAAAILGAAGFKRSKVAGVEQWSNSKSGSSLPADLVPFDMLFEYIRLPDVLPKSEDEDEDNDIEVVIGREEIRGVESTYYTLTVSARSFDVEKLRSALALKLQRPSNMIQFGLGRSQFKVVGQ